jgi:hypothetical protein
MEKSFDEIVNEIIGTDEDFKYLSKRHIKLKNNINELFKLDDLTIKDKATVSSYIHHGILNQYYNEKGRLSKIKQQYEELEQQYINTYGKKENNIRYVSKKLFENEDSIVKLKKVLLEQEELIKYLHDVLQIFDKFNFNIKNVVDLIKLEQ